jgi:hypothetical protein
MLEGQLRNTYENGSPVKGIPPEKTPAETLSGYSFEELMKSSFQRPAPVVEGLVHEGHSAIFAGGFGEGKTFLALQLSVCLAAGRDFLGRRVRRPYRTVFLDAENGKGEIKHRAAQLADQLQLSDEELAKLRQNWRLEDFEDDGPLHWLNLGEAVGFSRLGEYIDRTGTEVMFFDCFGKVFAKKETEEDSIKAFCDGLGKLIRGHKSLHTGFLQFLHHVTKFNAEGAGYNLLDHPREFLGKVRGSGRLLDLVQDRLAMEQQRSAGDPYYVVNGILRSGTIAPLILRRNETGFFELHDDKALVEEKAFSSARKQRALYQLMKERFTGQPQFTYTQVAALRDVNDGKFYSQTVADMLQAACTNRLLLPLREGGYAFPKFDGGTDR